jgi:hypothetical protein
VNWLPWSEWMTVEGEVALDPSTLPVDPRAIEAPEDLSDSGIAERDRDFGALHLTSRHVGNSEVTVRPTA